VIGFVLAGFLAVAVPMHVWSDLFLTGHGPLTTIENAIVGPFVAIISFVCSIGNVALASALWTDGISFGGVIAFLFADLITIPLLLMYRTMYGGRITLRLLALLWPVMSASGLITELLFRAVGGVPNRSPTVVATERVAWNYTTVLNIVFVVVFAALLWLHRHHDRFDNAHAHAVDPVCRMQVEKANAAATISLGDETVYFCSERCRDRFVKNPVRSSR
jgi:YHS domain-containing protein